MSNYQPSGAYLTTAMQSNAGSNFVGTSQSSLFQQTSLMSNYQSAANYLTTAMLSNASSVFAGTGTTFAGTNVSGSITLNSNGLNLALSAGAGGGGSINISAGSTSNNLTAFTISNANGVSFGLNGSVLTASVAAAGGAQTGISGISAGSVLLSSGTLSFGNGNGVSFGLNNSVITASVATNYQSQGAYLTTAMASNAGSNFIGLNTAITNGSLTANSSGISINIPTQSQYSFSNANNVTFGTAGSTVTASASFAQTVQPMYYSASGTSSSNGTLQFGNTQGVSFSLSNGSIIGSVATNYQSQGAYLTTAMASNAGSNFAGINETIGTITGTNLLMTVDTSGVNISYPKWITTGMQSDAGSNFAGLGSGITGASMTFNSNGLSLNVPAAAPSPVYVQAGTSNGSLGTISFSNNNGVSFGLSGSTITASVANGIILGDWEPFQLGNNTSYSSIGQNTIQFAQLYPAANVSMTAFEMLLSISSASSSISHSANNIFSYCLYSQGSGTNSSRIESISSGSLGMTVSYSSNLSGGFTIAQGANSFSSSSAGTNFASILTGQKIASYPLNTLLSGGGAYYLGFANSTNSLGGTGALRISHLFMTMATNASFGAIAPNGISASNTSFVHEPWGFIYSATSGAFPATVGYNQFSIQSINNPYLFLED